MAKILPRICPIASIQSAYICTGSERVAAGWETFRLAKHMDSPIPNSLGLPFLFSVSLDSASFKRRSIIQWCKISFKHEFKLALADFALP